MLLDGADKDRIGGDPQEIAEGDILPAAITDTGCERDLNEDRYAVVESVSGTAWIVCDGMGGQTGGELAAQLAIDAIRRDLENLPERPGEVALKSAILEANRIIVLRRQNQAFANMGTTIVASLFSDSELTIGHVGDSRAYLIRDGAIQQLTVDHTYVQELVDAGQIKAEEALSHPQAHILTRCIGAEPGLQVQMQKYWIWPVDDESQSSDVLLMCSDGLYSMISDGEISHIVSSCPPRRACIELVELAKKRGGYDNITLSIIPLPGELKGEPPAGHEEKLQKKKEKARRLTQQYSRYEPSFLRVASIIFVLSTLAILVTILAVAFMVRAG